MNHKKLKQRFEDYIGPSKTVTQENKDRFYQWMEGERASNKKKIKKQKHLFPKLASAFLVLGLILIGSNFIHFNQTDSDIDTKSVVGERVPFEEVSNKISEIEAKFSLSMTKTEAENVFGEGITYTDKASGEEITEYHFLGTDKTKHKQMEVRKAPFLSGDIGVHFKIAWKQDKANYAAIHYLDQNKELANITYKSNGMVYKNNRFVRNALYPLDASSLLVKSIARSMEVQPEKIDEQKLKDIKSLTLEPSDSDIFEELLQKDFTYIRQMSRLETLHLKGIAVPIDTIIELSNLKKLVIDGSTQLISSEKRLGIISKMPNLEVIEITEVKSGLDLRGLASSKSLEQVIVDKDKVANWEMLEQAGIVVTDKE
ncbi:hypothetical protein GWK91_00250 [Virgibacillus sp. MSP4-1]|uniref:hypothetical protein n=1 Tax=Virgibacillus sp. MSP4-1 TaxID=2700081 RepID=UPI00039ED635|nr:hypothetical protein [Virgibacillus sp. MSP4-1]QHS21481.1 hypothetical protein GWK91_00250 [Virgibacillus sp. MSP4-1]